jgi:SAM-dependent methyltransferase
VNLQLQRIRFRTIETAKRFPHCQVLGIDLALRELDDDQKLPNLSFEVHDVNNGLDKHHSQFDLVHARLIQAGTKDFVRFQHDVEACLKPGGIMIFIDGDWRTYAEDGVTAATMPVIDEDGYAIHSIIEGDKNTDDGASHTNIDTQKKSGKPSWFRQMISEVANANCLAGGDNMKYFTDHGFWHHPLCDPGNAFTANLLIPIGTWATGKYPILSLLYDYFFQFVILSFLANPIPHTTYHISQILTRHKLKSSSKLVN